MSTGRLATKLTQFGFSIEQVDSERKTLLDMYAQAIIDGKDKSTLAATATPVTQTVAYDVDLERQLLEFQREQLVFARERAAREEQRGLRGVGHGE